MTDIHTIKNYILPSILNIQTLILLFIIIFSYIIYYFLQKKHKINTSIINIEPSINIEKYINLIQDLQQNIDKHNKEEFYRKLYNIITDFLSKSGFKNIENMTLEEIYTKHNQYVYNFLKHIYINGYNKTQVSKNTKQKHINLTKEFIINYKIG